MDHCLVEEEEEQQQQQQYQQQQELQDGALKGRHSKNSIVIIPAAALSSFSAVPTNNGVFSASLEQEPLVQKEEVCDTHKEEEKEPYTQKDGETNNAVENDNHFNDDSAAAEIGMVTEFVETVANGEALKGITIDVDASQDKNSVYFDKQQGNDVDGASFVPPKSLGELEFDIRVENFDISSPCNEVNNQCMKTVADKVPLHNSSEIQATTVENCGDESSAKAYPNLTEEIDKQPKELDVETVLAKQETHDLFCPNCKSCITKRVILRKRKRNIPNLDTKSKRDKSDTELVTSFVPEANQVGLAIATSDVDPLEPPAHNHEPEREPEVFRCLACFSFFIPIRNGFKLFPSFGGTSEPEILQNASAIPASNVENPSVLPASNANWFLDLLFPPNKGKKPSRQGDPSMEDSRTDPAEQPHSASFTNVLTSPAIGNPESPPFNAANNSMDVKLTPGGHGGVNSLVPPEEKIGPWIENDNKSSKPLQNEPLVDQNDLSSTQISAESSGDVMTGLQKDKKDFIDFSPREQLLTDNVRADVGEKKHDPVDMLKTDIPKPESVVLPTDATTEINVNAGKPAKDAIPKSYDGSPVFEKSQKDVDKTPEMAEDSYSSLMEEAQSPTSQSLASAVVANDIASDQQSSEVNATIPSDQDFEKVQKDNEEDINLSIAKEKKEATISSTSQAVDNVPTEGTTGTETDTQIYIGEQSSAEIGEHQEWEIVKSIVYGGLIESITSLGIVSSAVSSGAAPLSIIAMGLANLIAGLFVIGHNLIELKNDSSREDRYQELLGRRANFVLHVVVTVLSFIIFGSVPLVVYGLLIGKNFYDEVKLATVAATSAICIVLLVIGKVYTSSAPKSYMKTVLKYVTMAVAASGISYIAGDLLKHVLDKFSHSTESGFVLTLPFSGTRKMKPARMSY